MRIYSEIEYQGNIMRGFHDNASSDTVAIITHGIGGNKLGHKFIFKQFADYCVYNNISVLRYDFVGTGESDGLFEDTRHSDQVNQVKKIIDYAEQLGYKNIVLCSTTIGCYSVWHAGKDDSRINAFVNWNSIFNYDRYEQGHRSRASEDGSIQMKGIYTKPSYVEDLSILDRKVPQHDVPVLILQGELDGECEFNDARDTCAEYGWNYKVIENGNHLWEGIEVRKNLFSETVNFIKDIIA